MIFLSCDYNFSQWTNCTDRVLSESERATMGQNVLNLFEKVTSILNNNNLIPSISLRCLVSKYNNYDGSNNCYYSETDWINKLNNLIWIRYQEYWPDVRTNDSLAFLNQLEEMNMNIPSLQVHAYGIAPNTTIDPYKKTLFHQLRTLS